MTLIPKFFHDSQSLIEDLQKKSSKYPLIARQYLPIVEKHAKKYPKHLYFDDWLLIPYFQWLWLSTQEDSHGETARKWLDRHEDILKHIYNCLGEAKFEEECKNLLTSVMHKTINGVHNKLLDFYGEMKGMLYFADRGYAITRIPRNSHKTPDFFAHKDKDTVLVECKFIHDSDSIGTFIRRYTYFLSENQVFWKTNRIRPLDCFFCNAHPKDLSSSNIEDLKKFINYVAVEKPSLHQVILDCDGQQVSVTYERKDVIGPNCVTIKNQVAYFSNELKKFLNEYVLRRAKQLTPQLIEFSQGRPQRLCAYIFIELDQEYNAPWEEMDKEKFRILENFKRNQGLDVEVILETPTTRISSSNL